MITIYLDKNVFSHLSKAIEDKYSILRDKILSHKDEFIFLYSNAHLSDLKSDNTDIKYNEMEFIQSIVDGNHMVYESSGLKVLYESPKSVFDNMDGVDDFNPENIDLSKFTDEQKRVIYNVFDICSKSLNGELSEDWLTKRIPILSEGDIDNTKLVELINTLSYNLYQNHLFYKSIRDITIGNYNHESIKLDDSNIGEKQLLNSKLGLSFLDIVNTVMTQVGLSLSDLSMVYYMAYMLLDLFGYNKESRKTVKFKNIQIDSAHSFFGSYCDCIVSDDDGLRSKTKVLYKLFKNPTQVYSINEFINKFEEAIDNNRKSANEYFDEIKKDYQNRHIIKTEKTSEYSITHINTTHKYFGYFDYMVEKSSNDESVIILHRNNAMYKPILIREIEIVVNRFVNALNNIGANFLLFNKEIEYPLIKVDEWGRYIELNDSVISLTKFKNASMLCLCIKPKNK